MDIFRNILGKNKPKGPVYEQIKPGDIKYTAPFDSNGIANALVHDINNLYRVSVINDKNELIKTTQYQYHNDPKNGWYNGYIIAKDTHDTIYSMKYLFDKNLQKIEGLPYSDYSFTGISDGYIWVFGLGTEFSKRGVIKNLKELIPPIYRDGMYMGNDQFVMDKGNGEKDVFVIKDGSMVKL